jgi:hypothetical protein
MKLVEPEGAGKNAESAGVSFSLFVPGEVIVFFAVEKLEKFSLGVIWQLKTEKKEDMTVIRSVAL